MNEYRVNLDVYNGPLDLLLYLIRRDELDITDIPISAVTEQYIKYVEMIQQVDPNLAGEFLVLAASLMEIKTRMLLPASAVEEGAEQTATSGLDPRAELVRQLLEYKAFKDAATDLASAAEMQAKKFPRRPAEQASQKDELDLEDVQVWDLLDAFSKLMASIGQQKRQHEVIYDDTPVELHAEDIMDRLSREGSMTFEKVFEGRTVRSEIVGLFLALLELVRQKRVFALQDANFGQIMIQPNPNPPPMDAAGHVAGFADDNLADGEAASQKQSGEYISDRPSVHEAANAGAPPKGKSDEPDSESPFAGSAGLDEPSDASAVALDENDDSSDADDDDDDDEADEDEDDDDESDDDDDEFDDDDYEDDEDDEDDEDEDFDEDEDEDDDVDEAEEPKDDKTG